MSKSYDSNGELRSAFTMRLLKQARQTATGGIYGMLLRITLATMFMFLAFMSHKLLGAMGLVYISLLFIVLVFTPVLVRLFKRPSEKKTAEGGADSQCVDAQVRPQG